MFELSQHGHDVHVGSGPQYPWGGLYGGQIVAQALRAATISVDEELEPHSIRAYFIRRGDASEPIRYEVDRIRNGRSFATRRVVARQAVGAILNAESSFQRPETSPTVQTVSMPKVPEPASLTAESWTDAFDRVDVPIDAVSASQRDGGGRVVTWMKVTNPIGDPADRASQLIHRCWLTYLSDDLPTESVLNMHPISSEEGAEEFRFAASLDHTVWFHRPVVADEWHLYDFSCLHLVSGRGLSLGHVFSPDGAHVATVAQEVLVRDSRNRG
ncbi:acyl-CoA thioesterase [Ilumatobacter coccineus]|uniref:Acyl-CoA thioesterase II n=1 Tax=Ilumatobacter coccineus (strain NBRC 103263 / KCTC 29153 / YM16-304) TaxID=1313172 RepID=A0A6C7E991_ILUCY|nr:acyl-CoA thioesterase domain-containing protein [Ilumatobacter coccineus]BAN04204.1 acyl-CoA thioesterase II [Ilumatobacter coccineus YM16-304]